MEADISQNVRSSTHCYEQLFSGSTTSSFRLDFTFPTVVSRLMSIPRVQRRIVLHDNDLAIKQFKNIDGLVNVIGDCVGGGYFLTQTVQNVLILNAALRHLYLTHGTLH